MYQTLHVEPGDPARRYPIFIGEGILAESGLFYPFIKGRQICLVTNHTIAPLYLEPLKALLSAQYQVDTVILPDGESWKSLETTQQIFDALLHNKHNRTTTLIALGGGVVGDITGFAAACYQRGVNFIQVPTTLLSQVDSSVGGKTGVNHPLGKNMIGAFHQPEAVIIDTAVLSTLPARELSAGLAEVIKYGLIGDPAFYGWIEANIDRLLALDSPSIAEAIFRSCDNKARVVGEDEKESGIRAILNFGHTFGHAIEAAQGYGNWLHGEAVAAGMVIAATLSSLQGWLNREEVDRLRALLVTAGLPVKPPAGLSVDRFLELMSVDKKVLAGKPRLVLLQSIGQAVITDEVSVEDIGAAIDGCR